MENIKTRFINSFKVTIEALSGLPLEEDSPAYENLLSAERMLRLLEEDTNDR